MSKLECPCCGFPTLNELAAFEICGVCWWEDDGQSDRDAGVLRGGPNGKYSLATARANFLDHLHMYDLGNGIEAVENPSSRRLKLLEYIVAVRSGQEALCPQRLDWLLAAEIAERRVK